MNDLVTVDDEKPENSEDGNSGLNSPQVDPETGKPQQEIISSFKQAHNLCKKEYQAAKEGRLKVSGVVREKYDGGAPYKQEALSRAGQDWRNNFSTNFLASIVDRAKPQMLDPIKRTRYLTFAALLASREGAAEKTMVFRKAMTKLVRSWSGWSTLIDSISQDDYLHGNCAPGWVDDDWRPKAFGHDSTFLPEGAGQHAANQQYLMFRDSMVLNEFIQKTLGDKEVSGMAGYDWDGCVKAANSATGIRDESDDNQVQKQDKIRESGMPDASYEDGIKVVWLYYLLVKNWDGTVALWVTSEKDGHPIRKVERLHMSMEDAVTLFTLQTGNQRYYGSKGSGRMICNIHIAVDRGRNFDQDNRYLSSCAILECGDKDPNSIRIVVRHPFIMVEKGGTVVKEGIRFDWQAADYAERQLVQIAESIAGAFIPPKLDQGGSSNTKIEAAQQAEREMAVRDGVLGRFFGQFADFMGAIQRKVCSPENLKEAYRIHEECKTKEQSGIRVIAKRVYDWIKDIIGLTEKDHSAEPMSSTADPEAVQCLVEMLKEGLTVENIAELALSSARNTLEEEGPAQDEKTAQFIEAKQGNPFYDQKKMAGLQAELMIGEDRAQQILLPDKEDPNIEAIAIRQQIVEFGEMMAGEMMPVASTDSHRIHRRVLTEKATPLIQTIETGAKTGRLTPELLKSAEMILAHLTAHLQMDAETTPEQKAQEEQGLAMWVSVIEAGGKAMEAMAKEMTAGGPPPVAGKPLAAQGPNGAIVGDPKLDLDREKLQSDVVLKAAEIKVKNRALDLKEKELTILDEHNQMSMATEVMTDAAHANAEAQKAGLKDAAADLKAMVHPREGQ